MSTDHRSHACCRRGFLHSMGAAAATLALRLDGPLAAEAPEAETARKREPATVRGAFLYPPSEKLRAKGGWWSWPGKDFDAEGRQKQYMARIREIERRLGMHISMNERPLDDAASVAQFIGELKEATPDSLLLIPFKHSHFAQVDTILKEARVPAVIYSCLGVKHGSIKGYQRAGLCFIQSLDNLDALEYGLRMVRTAKAMSQSRILSIAGGASRESTVAHLGTQVRALPMKRFTDEVDRTEITDAVRELARAYAKNARKIVEPAEAAILTAARVHVATRRLLEAEQGDAIMIDCLRRGLYMPCMSFMSLRDEGIAAGCENDLGATLTLMLVQHLFDRPGFQANPACDTEKNHYFHSHCTCPSKLLGTSQPSEPYLLRDYAHTNDPTCVPQVLWRPGEPVTMARYDPGNPPQMLLYSGQVVQSHAMPPVGGCRTNVEITIRELDDVADVKGHHNVLFYGDHARRLRQFARLYGIRVVT